MIQALSWLHDSIRTICRVRLNTLDIFRRRNQALEESIRGAGED
jgi:hypothetical protein